MKPIKINFDFKKLLSAQKTTDWKKSVYFILLLVTLAYIGMLAFLYLKPPAIEVRDQVNQEVPTEEIKIKFDVIDSIKNKVFPQ